MEKKNFIISFLEEQAIKYAAITKKEFKDMMKINGKKNFFEGFQRKIENIKENVNFYLEIDNDFNFFYSIPLISIYIKFNNNTVVFDCFSETLYWYKKESDLFFVNNKPVIYEDHKNYKIIQRNEPVIFNLVLFFTGTYNCIFTENYHSIIDDWGNNFNKTKIKNYFCLYRNFSTEELNNLV